MLFLLQGDGGVPGFVGVAGRPGNLNCTQNVFLNELMYMKSRNYPSAKVFIYYIKIRQYP